MSTGMDVHLYTYQHYFFGLTTLVCVIILLTVPVGNIKCILCSSWLPEQARRTHLARLGLPALILHKEKTAWSRLNTMFIIFGCCQQWRIKFLPDWDCLL